MIEFPSVVEAVSCALAVQRAMAERNAGTPEEKRIAFRVGVNLGDIIVEDGDIHGDGVNIAARLEGIAAPGGICISEDAFRQVRGKIDAEFTDPGERSLKNIAPNAILEGSDTDLCRSLRRQARGNMRSSVLVEVT